MFIESGQLDDEEQIIAILRQKVSNSDSYTQAEISEQRRENFEAYYLQPYGNEEEGKSSHVSSDVFDSVEGIKSILVQAFASGRKVVYFRAKDSNDNMAVLHADKYCQIQWDRNDGYRFLIDSLHDGLLSKVAIAKVTWESETEVVPQEFQGITQQQLAMLDQDERVREFEVTDQQQVMMPTPMGPMPAVVYSGSAMVEEVKERSQLRLVKPEAFFADAEAEKDTDFTFAADYEPVMRGDLMQKYPQRAADIERASDQRHEWDSEEHRARHANDATTTRQHQDERLRDRDRLAVYDCYIKHEGHLGFGIYNYVYVDRVLLEAELVDRMPYRVWSPFPLSHRWDGLAAADLTVDLQRSQSKLKRSVIDHAVRTTNPQREANLEWINNPQDLIDNVTGAVIDRTTDDQVVMPIPQPVMDPVVFNVVEMFQREREHRTGYSRLSAGQDPSALSQQNSFDLIAMMAASGDRRSAMMARSYAELFLKPIFLELYDLGRLNDREMYDVEVGGEWQRIEPNAFPERKDIEVDPALTAEQGLQAAQSKMLWHNLVMQDPSAKHLYPDVKRAKTYVDILSDMGVCNGEAYLQAPGSPEFQQSVQATQQMAQETQQMQEEVQRLQLQLQDRALGIEEAKVRSEHAIKLEKLRLDAAIGGERQALEEKDQADDASVDQEKLDIEWAKLGQQKSEGQGALA